MDDNFGFTPESETEDNSFGFDLAPEEKSKVAEYMKSQEPDMGEAALRGAEQGLLFNFADELGSGIGAGTEAVYNAATGNPEAQKLSDLYNEYLKFNRERYKAAEQAHPMTYTLGAIGGGSLVPTSVLGKVGMLGKTAPFSEKVIKGAAIGGLGGGLSGAGGSEAPIMSGEFARDVYQGAKYGTALGAGLPMAAEAGKFAAKGAKAIASPVLKGAQQGLRGVNLLGDEAEKQIQSNIASYGKELTGTIEGKLNELGRLKKEIVEQAEASGVRINSGDIDDMIAARLGNDPATNLPEVKREMEQFKELLRTAKEGPLVQKTERVFFGDRPTKIEQFKQQASAKQQLQNLNQVNPGMVESTPDSEFYKKVASKVIDNDDQEAIDQLKALLAQKQAEQRALPGADTNPLELVFEPTGVQNQQVGIIRQKQFNPGQTTLPKAAPQPYEMIFQQTDDPNTVLGVIRQPIMDESGNVVNYKTVQSKLLPKEEAAKFKDITVESRAGGQDLTKPSELLQLYKDLKQKSTYGDYSFKSQEAQKAAGQTIQDVQGLLRSAVPGLEETDAKIASLKRGAKAIGMEDTMDFDPQKMMNKVIDLINKQETVGGTGGKARQQLAEFVGAIKDHHPELAAQVDAKIKDLGEQAITSKAVAGIVQPGVVNTIKRSAVAAGNAVGFTLHELGKVPPQQLTEMGQRILNSQPSQAAQAVGSALIKAATEPARSRNAILFGLMQNPAYRQYLTQESREDESKQTYNFMEKTDFALLLDLVLDLKEEQSEIKEMVVKQGVILERNTEIVEEHERRSTASEHRLELLERRDLMINGFLKISAGLAGVIGTVWGVIEIILKFLGK